MEENEYGIREGSPLNPYVIGTATETTVDGFTYGTTAPARRVSSRVQHYVEQAGHAAAGITFAALELTLDAAARAAVAR